MMYEDEIRERLTRLAVEVLEICDLLDSQPRGKEYVDKILRTGTAWVPHYAEAVVAESDMELVLKLGLVVRDVAATLACLKEIEKVGLLYPETLWHIQDECRALSRVISDRRKRSLENMVRTAGR
jgi:four helix bundle protein